MKLIKVYSKQNCSYCERAKKLLEKFLQNDDSLKVEILTLDDEESISNLKKVFSDKGLLPPKTVPCIFYKESENSEEIFIGGYNELQEFLPKIGKLD